MALSSLNYEMDPRGVFHLTRPDNGETWGWIEYRGGRFRITRADHRLVQPHGFKKLKAAEYFALALAIEEEG